MSEIRPNPDALLAVAQDEESKRKRGQLKIFFGAAPGVGKTYTMLQDAQLLKNAGVDVVVGLVESHGRADTQKLLDNFEILPRLKLDYRDQVLAEFNLDLALQRKPGLIIVDEMAHSNAPGARHTKRWQDIKELIDRGIDVYTTLNVQHVESLNNIVEQITDVKVRETVPDSILELANTIELVDLSPEDLLKRMKEGKVYIPEQAKLATQSFFRKQNLVALRELALRFTAEKVNTEVLLQRKAMSVTNTWPTSERLLVCVGPGDAAAKLIRAAKRMASRLQAEWIAVYVEAPRLRLSEAERNSVLQNLRLAEQLGAETVTLNGRDVVKEIMAFANHSNVSKIILDKQVKPRWKDLLFGSLVDELMRYSGDIDIYIIRGDDDEVIRPKKELPSRKTIPWAAYGIAALYVALATGLNFLLYGYIGISNLIMVYLLTVIVIAMRGRRGPAIFGSFLSVLLYDFFFIPPRFSFVVADTQYLITLIIMLVVAQVISHLTLVVQEQATTVRWREKYTAALHALSKQLASHRGIDALSVIATRYIAELFDAKVQILLEKEKTLVVRAAYPEAMVLDSKEASVAQWTYDLGQMAGLGTQTLPFSEALYLPLVGSKITMGVLRVQPSDAKRLENLEQLRLLKACTQQIALALEVDRLQEESLRIQAEIDNERLRSTLLSAVSHDLLTPLGAIMDSANSLTKLTSGTAGELTQHLYNEAERLDNFIKNLLQILSLESGQVFLLKQPNSLKELTDSALVKVEKNLHDRPVQISFPDNLPPVLCDKNLMHQVLINLLDNAARYSPPHNTITIGAELQKDEVVVKIADQGHSLSTEELKNIFNKFYRGHNAKGIEGAGLGLTICESIIKAHGGKIWVEQPKEGGTIFYFTLPASQH